MAEHRAPGRRRAARPTRRSGRVRALLALGTVVGIGATATGAYWTDTATLTTGTIASGEMHIDLATNNKVKPETYAWGDLTVAGLYPGATVARTIAVTNNSVPGLSFTYRIQGSAAGSLASSLQMTIRRGGTSNGTTCSGGTQIGTANAAVSGYDVAAGEALTAAGVPSSHTLCVQLRLDPNAPNATQNQTGSTVTLTFPATQVVP